MRALLLPCIPCGKAAAAALMLLAAAAAPATGAICDEGSVLTLLGLDTAAGRALFVVSPASGGGEPALLEVVAGRAQALLHRSPPPPLFAGSVGPGPVFALERCGEGCLRPQRFHQGGWQPLGGPLTSPPGSSAYTTWDRAWQPWVVLHQREESGGVTARAFRLEEGEWQAKGSLTVAAVGLPAAGPSPRHLDVVLSGTALFAAASAPRSWLAGLPPEAGEIEGEVTSLGGDTAAWVSAEGDTLLSEDAGTTWRPFGQRPRPTGAPEELELDRPTGDPLGPLAVVWSDLGADPPELILAELAPSGGMKPDWREIARMSSEAAVAGGTALRFEHYLRPGEGRWLLLTGCAVTPRGSGLVALEVDEEGVGPARFVPVVEAPAVR